MKRARVIYNPSSGRETVRNKIVDILESLERIGFETSTFATKGKGDAQREAERCSKEGFDLLVASGGDGTIHEVINGIAEMNKKPKIGVLPMGTSNDFAKALDIPLDFDKALETLLKGKSKKIDIGKMNEKYFINIAGGGALTELTYEVPSKLKTLLGQLAYYIKGIEKLPNFKSFTLEIETEHGKLTEEVMLFLIANSAVVGSFRNLAPKAKLNDGKLDILLLKKCNLAELARILAMLPRGKHIKEPKIEYIQSEWIKIKAEKDVVINLDGELGGEIPCNFQVLKKHIEVICN